MVFSTTYPNTLNLREIRIPMPPIRSLVSKPKLQKARWVFLKTEEQEHQVDYRSLIDN